MGGGVGVIKADTPPLHLGACSSKGFTVKCWSWNVSRNALRIVSTVFCLVLQRKLSLPLIVLCIFPTDAVYFLVSGCPCWECRRLGMWQAGCFHVLGQSKTCLLCLLPTPCTWLVPRTRLFNAWLLIAFEINTLKLLVGDF